MSSVMRVIAGSERHLLAGSAAVAAVDPEKTIKLTIYVRAKKAKSTSRCCLKSDTVRTNFGAR